MKWIDRNHQEVPEYDWVILAFDVEGENNSGDFAWQIGRRIGNQIEFWGAEEGAGPYQGDAFWTWKPEYSTHWMEFNPYEQQISKS